MSRPKYSTLHLGPFGTFHSGSGVDVDFVHLPVTVISRAAGLRVECVSVADLRDVLTAHWHATGGRFYIEDVLAWAMDFSAPMGPNEVTSNQRHVSVDIDWLRY